MPFKTIRYYPYHSGVVQYGTVVVSSSIIIDRALIVIVHHGYITLHICCTRSSVVVLKLCHRHRIYPSLVDLFSILFHVRFLQYKVRFIL